VPLRPLLNLARRLIDPWRIAGKNGVHELNYTLAQTHHPRSEDSFGLLHEVSNRRAQPPDISVNPERLHTLPDR
jgi:hypothetical protein